MKRVLPVLAAALVIALGMAGCAKDEGPDKGNNPITNSAWDVNEQPRDNVQDGGEFRGAFGSEVETWNLNTATGNDYELKFALSPLFENWYLQDGSGNHTMNTNYLVSLTDEMVDGKLVVTFKISDKAVWNDGAPIVAADWIATWNALKGEDEDYSVASSDGWDEIETMVQGATDKDVIITFQAAYPDWVGLFVGSPMRAESCSDAKTFNDGWGEYKLGWWSGPYVVTDYAPSSFTITMERNPDWWGDTGKLDKIIFKFVDSSQMATAFANGELDYIDIGANANNYAQAKDRPDAEIRQSGGPNYRHFTFNSKSEVLQDLNVRQAIVMGLDRDQITESDLAGLPIDPVKASKNSNLWMQGQDGYTDWAEITGLKYDPEAAKAKLEEAGYEMGADGYYAKDGKTLELGFSVLTGVRTSENEGQLAQDQLKEIGIKLNLVPVNTATDWPRVLVEHEFDIIAFSWMGTAFPLANIGQLFGEGSDSNYAQLTTEKVEELKSKINTENDPATRIAMAQEVDQALWENVHTLPLYQRPALTGVTKGLANFGSLGLAQVPYAWVNVGFQK
ncbi:MAG: ABC transporter family substrate-binding protein [Propionibacteriaceae bacterium]|nr:ABC transporter family substrate-binding protein [Propionibacteriaceae bacterium]